MGECVHLIPRLILPLRPATLILYAADNDLDQGASPEHVLWLFQQFIERVRDTFPALPIAFVSVKPSPARFWNLSNIRKANELVRAATAADFIGVTYIDVFALMLSPAGGSRPELYTGDGLHMNSAGYDLWTKEIRSWLNSLSAPSTYT